MKKNDSDFKMMENMAEDLVALTFALCERRLAAARVPLTPAQEALSSAAMIVHQSVELFLAVTQIPDQPRLGQ